MDVLAAPSIKTSLWEVSVYVLHCITHWSNAKTPSHSEAPKHKSTEK